MLLIKNSARLLSSKPQSLARQPLLLIRRSDLNLVSVFSTKGYRINTCINLNKFFNTLVAGRPVATNNCFVSRGFFIQIAHQSTETNRRRAKQINLHDIGEGISEVVVKEWKVKVGDSVRQSDEICEVESDKAAVAIQSPFDGVITKLHYDEGSIAKVGLPLVDISSDSDQPEKQEVEPGAATTGYDNSSHQVNKFEESIPLTADESKLTATGQTVVVATMPSVRRLARERNVDLSKVKPTGKIGQILMDDLVAYLEAESQAAASATLAWQGSQRSKNCENELGTNHLNAFDTTNLSKQSRRQQQQLLETPVPLSGIQKAMFRSMTQSLKIPHFSYSDEIDLTRLVEASTRRRTDGFPKELRRAALGEKLNASLDEAGEQLVVKHCHNIGVAVDTPAGLVVPNVKNVQNLSIIEINLELRRLRSLGYSSKLSLSDLSGGTFTLSNIGAIGGIFGIPVLMSPEIVIGALGRIRKLPRFNSSSGSGVEGRHVMQIVWSADHRIVDGATLSRFSNLLKHYLEEPESGLLKLA